MLARRLGRSRPFSQSLPSGKVNAFLISSQERSAGDQAAWPPCAGRCCASAWLCRIQKPSLLPPQQAARHAPTPSSTFRTVKDIQVVQVIVDGRFHSHEEQARSRGCSYGSQSLLIRGLPIHHKGNYHGYQRDELTRDLQVVSSHPIKSRDRYAAKDRSPVSRAIQVEHIDANVQRALRVYLSQRR